MKKRYFLAIAALSTLAATAQVGVGTTTPQAALDVTATDKGMLVPRIALTDTQTAAPVTNPEGGTLVNGTLIYNTATAGAAPNNVLPGFYYWQDSGWVAVNGSKTLDAAYDGSGAGAGKIITADAGHVQIAGTDGLLVTGTLEVGTEAPLSGQGVRMFFYPKKGAFRAGGAASDQWDDGNIGYHSTATGYATRASAIYSTAFGYLTTASGYYSTAMGRGSIASGQNSTAMGYFSTASGNFSTAMGESSNAIGSYSVAMGRGNTALSYGETVLGVFSTEIWSPNNTFFASSDRLFTVGNGTSATARADALTLYKNGNLVLSSTYASKPGGGEWLGTSDARLKKDVVQFKDGLEQVLAINPVNYHYNEVSGLDTSKEYVGVIAQELQKIAPYMVGNFTQDGTEYLNVDSSAIKYMLINAVKEQQAIIEKQNQRLDVLEKALLQLTAKEEAPANGGTTNQSKK
jgi:hypothetical protein